MGTLAGCIKRAGKALSSSDATAIQQIRDEYVSGDTVANVAADQAVRDYLEILSQERDALISKIQAAGGDISSITGEIHFASTPTQVEVPRPEEVDVPTLPIARVERELRDAWRRAKKAGVSLTSRRLSAVFGSPKPVKGTEKTLGKDVKPTSYDELKKMIEWALDNVHTEGGWYDQFGKGIEAIVGQANMAEASMIFGITSQQNAAETNLADTLHIMALARRIDPVSNPKGFEQSLRKDPRPDGQRLKITQPQINRILQLYKTGQLLYETDAGLKITNYMNTTRLRADNLWTPYSVQDVHMSRVFGYRFKKKDKKTKAIVDASQFNNPNQIRYAQYLTGMLAMEYGMQPYEAQALLWFYAKTNLSPKADVKKDKKVGAGTWESAESYAQPEIKQARDLQEAGDWDTGTPFNEELGRGELAKFQQQTKSDPYNNYELNQKLLEVARARAPKIVASFNPGNAKGYGFPADVTFDYLRDFQESILNSILDENGQIPLLRDLGIPHEVHESVGTFERMEPGVTISLLGGTMAQADLVAPILGEAFLQDAVITETTKWDGDPFAILVRKKDGTVFSQEELEAMFKQMNPEASAAGMNFSASADGKALKFIDNVYYDKMFDDNADPYGEADFESFYAKISESLGEEYQYGHYSQEGMYFDEGPSEENRSEVWRRGAAKGSPDLQRTTLDSLYAPIWDVYKAAVQELGYTPQNLEPPIKGLESLPKQPPRKHKIRYAAPEEQLKAARGDPTGPHAIYHKVGATMEAQAQAGAPGGVRAWLNRVGDVSAKQKKHVLNLVGRRHYGDFIEGDSMPSIDSWNRIANRMEGMRNTLIEEQAELAKKWNRFVGRSKELGRILGELMQEATLQQVDPSIPFKPHMAYENMGFLDKQKDARRRAAHKILQGYYNDLGAEGQAIFNEVKQAYADRRERLETDLLNRIESSEMPDADKRVTMDTLRRKFEQGRIEPYFPLMRFGDYWAAAKDPETGETVSFSKFERKSQRTAWIKAMRQAGYEAHGGENIADTRSAVEKIDPGFVKEMVGMVEASEDPNTRALAGEIWEMYLRSLPELSMRKMQIRRLNRLGFNADNLRAFSHYMFHSAQQIARLNHVRELEDTLRQVHEEAKETEKLENQDSDWAMPVYQQMQWAHDWMMNPDTATWATALTTLGFGWYLGATPAAAFVNMTQTGLVAFPALGARFNFMGAGYELNKALVEFGRAKGKLENYDHLRGDEQRALKEARAIGLITQSQTRALTGMAEEGQEYNENIKTMINAVGWMFHEAEVLNRSITFLAAYRLSRKSGKSHELAVQEAEDLTWDSHFDYSSSGRPRITRGNVGRVIFLFRQYAMNMANRLVRDFNDGLLRPAYRGVRRQDFDTAQAKEAAQRFAGIMSMAALLGGATGLPLYSVVKAVLSKLLDPDKEDDEPYDSEAAFRSYLTDMYGQKVATLIMNGAFDAATGWTLSSRVSLSNLFWRDAPATYDMAQKWDHYIGEASGPVIGIFENMAFGVYYLTEPTAPGTMNKGYEKMVPKFVSDITKAFRYSQEGVTTRRGDVVVGVDELDWMDLLGQGVGFSPEIVSRGYAQGRAIKQIAMALDKRKRHLMTSMGLAVMSDDKREIAKWSSEISKWNKNNPRDTISRENIIRSAKSRRKYSAETFRGMHLDKEHRYLIEKYDFMSTEGQEGD